MGSSGRRFDDRTRSLVRQLARRASLAVDNARLFEDQRRIAGTLQQSLLPRELPEIEGLETAARFSPGGDGHEVGGDFYDVFEARGSWAVIVGDVCGKGAAAAGLTSLCRHAARTLSRHDPPPSQLLTELNERIMLEPDVDLRFSTAAYARLTRSAGALIATVSSAGHPLPLVVRASGRVEELGEPGTLLGLLPVVRVTDQSDRARAGRRAGDVHRRRHRGAARRDPLRRRAPARAGLGARGPAGRGDRRRHRGRRDRVPGRSAHRRPRGGGAPGDAVTDPARTRRRDPAWVWYALAIGIIAVLGLLDALGVLNGLGP